jgi:hypothetical protein
MEGIAEVIGMTIFCKEKIDEIRIKDGTLVYVMEDFDVKDIDLNRINIEKTVKSLIIRERTILATRGAKGATDKAKTAVKRRCYKEKDYSATEGNYWRAEGWFKRMESNSILKLSKTHCGICEKQQIQVARDRKRITHERLNEIKHYLNGSGKHGIDKHKL